MYSSEISSEPVIILGITESPTWIAIQDKLKEAFPALRWVETVRLPLQYFNLEEAPIKIKNQARTNVMMLVPGVVWDTVLDKTVAYNESMRIFDIVNGAYTFTAESAILWLKGALENDDFCLAQYGKTKVKTTLENEGYYYVSSTQDMSGPVLVVDSTNFKTGLCFLNGIIAPITALHPNLRIFNIKRKSGSDSYDLNKIPEDLPQYLVSKSYCLIPGPIWNSAMEDKKSHRLVEVFQPGTNMILLPVGCNLDWIKQTLLKQEFQSVPIPTPLPEEINSTMQDTKSITAPPIDYTTSQLEDTPIAVKNITKTCIYEWRQGDIKGTLCGKEVSPGYDFCDSCVRAGFDQYQLRSIRCHDQSKKPEIPNSTSVPSSHAFCTKCSAWVQKHDYCETCRCTLCVECWDTLHSFFPLTLHAKTVAQHKCSMDLWCTDAECKLGRTLYCRECVVESGHDGHSFRSAVEMAKERKEQVTNMVRYMEPMLTMLKLDANYDCKADESLCVRMKEDLDESNLVAVIVKRNVFIGEFKRFMKRALEELKQRLEK